MANLTSMVGEPMRLGRCYGHVSAARNSLRQLRQTSCSVPGARGRGQSHQRRLGRNGPRQSADSASMTQPGCPGDRAPELAE